ncbi:MAG: radical SAM protein [Sandaracinaceae bacterium]
MLLDVILGYDCNLACDYCTITPAMRARALSARDVVAAMRRGRADGLVDVSFTGGEPTIRQDLLAIVRAAKSLGFRDVKLQSNGLLFSPANVEKLVLAGVTTFHMSIHDADGAAYERTVRRAATYAAMQGGLEALVHAGLDPVVDVIMKRDTAPRLAETFAWIAERGARRIDLWFVSLTDNNRDNFDSMPRMTEVVPEIARAMGVAERLGLTVRSLHVPRCLLGAHAAIAYDPAAQRVRVVSPDAEFELSESRLTPQVHVPACDGCPDRPRCRGLRRDYLARYGDAEIAAARGVAPSRPAALRVFDR